jgi:hypothetical protein
MRQTERYHEAATARRVFNTQLEMLLDITGKDNHKSVLQMLRSLIEQKIHPSDWVDIAANIGGSEDHIRVCRCIGVALGSAWMSIHTSRRASKPPLYRPLAERIERVEAKARYAAREALGQTTTIKPGVGRGKHHRISPLWVQQTEAVGGGTVGRRFISRAVLVDQIGEYDLFEINFYENGASEGNLQTGYVGRYRGTKIRGFGHKPETALNWTRRQVVIEATRKLTR